MNLVNRLLLGVVIGTCLANNAFAQATPTPTVTPTLTASATPTPSACADLQSCVESAVPTAVASCASSNSSCILKSTDKLAVTAGELARRAIDIKHCGRFKRQSLCKACYELAKAPLFNRLDGQIFHGLLANASSLIQAEKLTVCNALAK